MINGHKPLAIAGTIILLLLAALSRVFWSAQQDTVDAIKLLSQRQISILERQGRLEEKMVASQQIMERIERRIDGRLTADQPYIYPADQRKAR